MTNSQEKALSELCRMIEDAEQRTKDHKRYFPDNVAAVGFCLGVVDGMRKARELLTKTLEDDSVKSWKELGYFNRLMVCGDCGSLICVMDTRIGTDRVLRLEDGCPACALKGHHYCLFTPLDVSDKAETVKAARKK